MGTMFMNTENCKTNKLDLRSSSKHAAFQNLYIYYPWKNMIKQD